MSNDKARVQEAGSVPAIISLERVQRIIEGSAEDVNTLNAICDRLEDTNLIGSANDYHNVAVGMSRLGCYPQAFRVVQQGLKSYPYNVDLLADAVYYGSSAGKWKDCEEYAARLNKRSKGLWNWRAFTFMIDYYMDRMDWLEDTDAILDSMITALKFSHQAQRILEHEERGYLAEARIHEALAKWYEDRASHSQATEQNAPMSADQYRQRAEEGRQQVMATLKAAISNPNMVAVQCCLRYADLQFEACNYEETIKICEAAMGYGESQPSARMGYFPYLAAMSMDCLIHRENAFEDVEKVKKCYQKYSTALALLEPDRITYRNNIRLRLNNLQIRTGIPYEGSF